MNMNGRSEATPALPATACVVSPAFTDTPKDKQGLQVRIGFHPGARTARRRCLRRRRHRRRRRRTPTPTPAPPANRPPTVTRGVRSVHG